MLAWPDAQFAQPSGESLARIRTAIVENFYGPQIAHDMMRDCSGWHAELHWEASFGFASFVSAAAPAAAGKAEWNC